MGQKIALSDTTFTNSSALIKLRDDSLLSSGSLFLFDPAHSLGGFSGVPATGTLLPNVAWKEAAALIGSGTQSSLSAIASYNTPGPTVFVAERSTKLGLHGMSTLGGTGQTANGNWVATLPTAVKTYVYTNRSTHSFYFSIWRRITRPGLTNAAPQSPFHYSAQSAATANFLFVTQGGVFSPTAIPPSIGNRTYPTGLDTVQSAGQGRYTSGGTSTFTGTGPDSVGLFDFGTGGFDAWGSFNWNKASSTIIYRVYVEDLTVSGRTYAQVDALDYALYQKEVETAGGKYFGDTYSNPATTVP